MSEQEQNRKINEINREIRRLTEKVRSLQLDMEPEGHITMGFNRLSEDIDRIENGLNRRIDALSHQINQVLAKQEVMLEALTKINDLPEE
jgi:uncharacterized coiled-coil DUF342 family protein